MLRYRLAGGWIDDHAANRIARDGAGIHGRAFCRAATTMRVMIVI